MSVAALAATLLAGCSSAPAALPATPSGAPATTAPSTASLLPSSATDARELPGAQTSIEPGTYRWAGFEPALELEIGDGWSVGHRHDTYFDLFRGGNFPAVGFGRFPRVVGGAGPVPASDAATVVAALRANPDLIFEEVGPASFAGLSGLTIDLRSSKPQAPVFQADDGNFNADPEFVARYHFLDVDGGVLLIGILAPDGELDTALPITAPLIGSIRIAE